MTLILASIVLMAAGCGDRKDSSAPPAPRAPESSVVEKASAPVTGQKDAGKALDLAKSVLDELPRLREGAPLSAWKKLRNNDTIEPYTAQLTEVEKWCARVRSEASLGPESKWVLTAYFYVPDVPMPPVLPASISGSELIGQCRLGLLWSEASAARLKAIEHYRVAFESAPENLRVTEVWPDAWRLIAGIAPVQTHFYCVYD